MATSEGDQIHSTVDSVAAAALRLASISNLISARVETTVRLGDREVRHDVSIEVGSAREAARDAAA